MKLPFKSKLTNQMLSTKVGAKIMTLRGGERGVDKKNPAYSFRKRQKSSYFQFFRLDPELPGFRTSQNIIGTQRWLQNSILSEPALE